MDPAINFKPQQHEIMVEAKIQNDLGITICMKQTHNKDRMKAVHQRITS